MSDPSANGISELLMIAVDAVQHFDAQRRASNAPTRLSTVV